MNRIQRMRIFLLTCAMTSAFGVNAFAGSGRIHKVKSAVPQEYIVVFKKDTPKGQVHGLAMRLAEEHGGQARKVWIDAVKGFFAVMTEKEAEALSRHPAVAFVEENAILSLDATVTPTNVDPSVCLPGSPGCSTTSDNRLWHLDRIDQDSAALGNTFASCKTGDGVDIYIVDSGVQGNHQEFSGPNNTTRVTTGYNASGDPWPANQPCGGWVAPAISPMLHAEEDFELGQFDRSHGTGVASLAAGNRVGVAKNATIVPVKVARCDRYSFRYRQPNHAYAVGDMVFDAAVLVAQNAAPNKFWIAVQAGTSANSDAVNWTATNGIKQDGTTLQWREYTERPTHSNFETTTQMMIDGLNWICQTAPTPSANTRRSVVSISMSKSLSETTNVTDDNDEDTADSVQLAVAALTSKGIPVIASANNLDADACDRGPAAFSKDNPNGYTGDVITVGGSMLINEPDSVTYDKSQPTRDRRWTCPDHTNCTNGSNGGPCVTLFAPAHELEVAYHYGTTSYRGRKVTPPTATAVSNSGTSWSAPLVAGVVAGYLQSAFFTVSQIRTKLIDDSRAHLDTETLQPKNNSNQTVSGTPNLLLQAGSVRIAAHPQNTPAAASGSTLLSVTSNPTSGVSYQWYQVNPEFDLTKKRGAASASIMNGQTSATLSVTPTVTTGYFVRVYECGAADSDIAVIVPRPTAPSNVVATKSGSNVVITWLAGSGADKYEVQRKVSGQAWATAGTVDANYLTFTDTPTAPGGMVIYRVLSLAGTSYLPSNNLAASAPSNLDIANVNTYENLAVAPAFTPFKAQMLIELRQAVNTLADAAGITPAPYSAEELLLSSLQNQGIQASYLTTLMTKINSVRTNAAIGMSSASFTTTPASNVLIHRSFVEDLRNALQ